ncbi:MAG TPA: NAD(P)H-dependent oxidoreductase subunit E [Firmicutes bacterium]|jgi:NADH-quinone oxidoreductase subunit E/NADP-reducing hydrogenase subunit HndA|nr:NAD(P)H-dependent oxidoreductase subunit E [Bacillota bacterium]
MNPISAYAKQRLDEIITQYKEVKTPLMMILSAFQKEFGYVPLEVQEIISKRLDIPVAEIYGIVTFYSMFSLKPKGKYVVGICLGTACYVQNAQQIANRLEEILGIKPGETTSDGLFTIDILRCLGACALAPVMVINGKILPHVKVNDLQRIIDEYIKMEAATYATSH